MHTKKKQNTKIESLFKKKKKQNKVKDTQKQTKNMQIKVNTKCVNKTKRVS